MPVIKPPAWRAFQAALCVLHTVPGAMCGLVSPHPRHQPPVFLGSVGLSAQMGRCLARLAASSAFPAGPSAPWLLTRSSVNRLSFLQLCFPATSTSWEGAVILSVPPCRGGRTA